MSFKKPSIVALPPVKAKSKTRKVSPQKSSKRPPTIVRAQSLSTSPTNTAEVINCQINPYLLTQFLFGYFGRGLQDSDAIFDAGLVSSLVYTFATLLNTGDIEALGTRSLPREIVDLYYSLRSTEWHGKRYFCNNIALNTFLATVGTSGWTVATGLLDVTIPATLGSGSTAGYYNIALLPSLLTGQALRDGLSQYGSSLRMVDILDKSRSSPQCFSFDTQNLFTTFSAQFQGMMPVALAGYVSANACYIRQDSYVAIEVPIKNFNWMFDLRLCTPLQYVKTGQVTFTDTTRFPLTGRAVHAFPSVIGHQMGSNKGEYRGVVQLKLVPYVSTLNDIIARIEALVTACGTATVAAWKAAFSAADIKLLAYGLWRAANSRYGASSYGVFFLNNAVTSLCETMFDSSGYKAFQMLRIPQVLNDCLQAQKVYSDKDGVIMPCYVRNLSLNSLVTGFTYTGTGAGTIPDDGFTTSYRYTTLAMSVVVKYKTFEQAFAGISKLCIVTAFGNSYLDVTLTRDNINFGGNAGNIVMASSRRPLTTPFLMSALLKAVYLSYDYAPASAVSLPTYTGAEDRSRIYRQKSCVVLSGTDSVSSVISSAITDGYVPLGAEASNASPMTDGDYTPMPVGAPTPSSSYRSLGYRAMSELPGLSSITYGNYGGPGYTAGSRDPSKWVHKNGKYLVPAADSEDEIYKRHDEAILAAAGNVLKEAAADAALHSELKEHGKAVGLSIFGRAAKTYFSPAVARDRSEL